MLSNIARRQLNNNRGSVLVLSVVISIAVVALGVAFLRYIFHEQQRLEFDIMTYQAYTSSHAAMVRGMAEHPSGGYGLVDRRREYYGYETSDIEYNYAISRININHSDSVGYTSSTAYYLTGLGYVTNPLYDGEMSYYVCHDMTARSYADWLYITVRETQSYRPQDGVQNILRFWGPDTLDGKVHTNDMFHFQQGNGAWPYFYEMVTACSTRWDPENAEDLVHFEGGSQLQVTQLPLAITADSIRKYDIYGLGVPPGSQNTYATEIVLMPDHFLVRTRNITGSAGSRNRPNYYVGDVTEEGKYNIKLGDAEGNPDYDKQYPYTGALFIEGELWLVGTKGFHFNCTNNTETQNFRVGGFSGELTIAASGDIIIPQDVLVQSANPDGTVPDSSEDVLGIISEKHILIWRNAPSTVKITAGLGAIGTGDEEDTLAALGPPSARCPNGNLPLDGVNGTISVDGINCYYWSNPKTRLLIYGCLIQRERGLIHSTHIAEERGYDSKDYMYDKRFRRHPPPHFFEQKSYNNFFYDSGDQVFYLR